MDKLTQAQILNLKGHKGRGMKLMTKDIFNELLKNGQRQVEIQTSDLNDFTADFKPVVKYFVGNATWLISEIDPENYDHAFGLCDLGVGEPELGWVSLSELSNLLVRGFFGVERDLHFIADKSLRDYAKIARQERHIAA